MLHIYAWEKIKLHQAHSEMYCADEFDTILYNSGRSNGQIP